jgi:hypothetical protein
VARLGEDHESGVAVQVDEAGRDDAVASIDQSGGPADRVLDRLGRAQDRESCAPPGLVPPDPDRAGEPGVAAAVDDRAAVDQQLEMGSAVQIHAGHDGRCGSVMPGGHRLAGGSLP